MAEILLCVHDRVPGDATQPMQGDVIVVMPDGWGWSSAELGVDQGPPNGKHIFFRIIKMPNVSVAAASTLLPREQSVDPLNPSPFLHYRARYLDKTKISPVTMQNLLDNWNDDGRAQGFLSVNFSAAQINTIVSTRPVIQWP